VASGGCSRSITPRPPPPGSRAPEWGDEGVYLCSASFRDYQFERYDCPEYADTPEQVADLFIDRYGPTHRAYHALAPDRAAAFRKDLIDLPQPHAGGRQKCVSRIHHALARRVKAKSIQGHVARQPIAAERGHVPLLSRASACAA
jgi:hypothetical protein